MAMTTTGRKIQEEIDDAKGFWKTREGYKQSMQRINPHNGEYLPGQ